MQCPRCQAENRQGRRFCAECGASLAVACPSCGFSNEPGEKFCGGCGLPLTAASPPLEPRSGPPHAYTPSHLAEKILTSKSALEGERKQVTVLFADLKGSMELLADRDPEEARQLLDPVLERMMEAVHRYEGTVNQVMGDGIMALFGAPLAHEDHAVRACYAALRMQDAIGRYAAEAIAETLGDVPLQVVAQYYLLLACHLSGDFRGTEHHCRRLMQSLQGEWVRERFGLAAFPAVMSGAYLARALAECGAFEEGDVHGQEAVRIGEALDHPFSIIWACLGLAYLNRLRGELGQAARLLERAITQCRERNIMFYTPIAMASLGHMYAWSGRLEGITRLQQALTTYEFAGLGVFHSLSVVQLGEAYLLADQVEDARACADRAVRLTCERAERGHEAWALRLLGEIASRHDHPDVATAEAHYGAAVALASELGMRPLQAHCHCGLGKLYAKIGRHAEARAALSAAIDLYRAMEMAFWLPRVEAELAMIE